ncbi:MAG: hypothetical protein ACP5JU_04000 [Minisyncoccia bacterium]
MLLVLLCLVCIVLKDGFNGSVEFIVGKLITAIKIVAFKIAMSLDFMHYDNSDSHGNDSQHTNPRRSVAWRFVGWQHFGACAEVINPLNPFLFYVIFVFFAIFLYGSHECASLDIIYTTNSTLRYLSYLFGSNNLKLFYLCYLLGGFYG